jgi:nitrite reductase (NADH) small subunit
MTADDRTWIKVSPCASIPPREGRCVEVDGRPIAIFHTNNGFLAVENRCPHRGGPLADGIVSGTTVVCPLHAWKFDLLSGASTNHPEAPRALIVYPTCIDDGIVCIQLPAGDAPGEITGIDCEHRDRPLRWVQRRLSPAAARVDSRGSSAASALPQTERPEGQGYAPQEL